MAYIDGNNDIVITKSLFECLKNDLDSIETIIYLFDKIVNFDDEFCVKNILATKKPINMQNKEQEKRIARILLNDLNNKFKYCFLSETNYVDVLRFIYSTFNTDELENELNTNLSRLTYMNDTALLLAIRLHGIECVQYMNINQITEQTSFNLINLLNNSAYDNDAMNKCIDMVDIVWCNKINEEHKIKFMNIENRVYKFEKIVDSLKLLKIAMQNICNFNDFKYFDSIFKMMSSDDFEEYYLYVLEILPRCYQSQKSVRKNVLAKIGMNNDLTTNIKQNKLKLLCELYKYDNNIYTEYNKKYRIVC